MKLSPFAVLVLLLSPLVSARAAVVINEIFYHAPDDLDDLQWIELHNTADRAVDVGGWTLDQGRTFTFPAGTTIAAQDYLVVALNPEHSQNIRPLPIGLLLSNSVPLQFEKHHIFCGEQGQWLLVGLNAVASNVLCLVAVLAGAALARGL